MDTSSLSYKKDFEENNLPMGLFERILKQIHDEQLMRMKRRLILICFGLTVTVGGVIPLFRLMETGFAQSGSMQMALLIFSDFSIIMADWQNFCVAILESLPVVSIAVFLSAVLGAIYLLAFLCRDLERIATARNLLAMR